MVARAAFVAVNIALFAGLWFFWTGVRDELSHVRFMETRYAVERAYLAAYDENRRELAEMLDERRISFAGEKLPALAEISSLGLAHGLDNSGFAASEPIAAYGGGVRFLETRVSAEFSGDAGRVHSFLTELEEMGGLIRSFSLDSSDETANLSVTFSLFGDE